MDAKPNGRRKSGLLWLLVLLAIVLLWWRWRASPDEQGFAAGVDVTDADPDDILVDLRDDVSEDVVRAIESAEGIDLVLVSAQSADERFYRAHVAADAQARILADLARRPEVEDAEPDALYAIPESEQTLAADATEEPTFRGFPNDPQYKHQWHLRQIGMPDAWKRANGDGVIVAVIDTGVAYEDWGRFHKVPDLAGTKLVPGWDFVGNTEHANDDHGHGTHVAGTIAQATNNEVGVAGVAWGASIMPLKVLSASGSGSVAAIADAIRFAADKGAKVINMSLGGRFGSKILARAVKYAHDKGVVVICAAGNDGRGRVSFPAAYPGAIAVAATQYDETTTFYSNWGKEIDVAAPGGNTRVDQDGDGRPDGVLQNTIVVGDPTRDDYLAFMGTSMASPHVAGVAALIVGQGVTEPDAVEKILEGSARAPKVGAFERDRYGAGIVDAPAAIGKARGSAGTWQLGLGLLLAGAIVARLRSAGRLAIALGPSYLAGVVVGASGLFFVSSLGNVGAAVASLPVVGMLTRGFPSWDLSILGVNGHGNVLFFSALAPVAAIAFGYGVRRLRAPLAGFAIGVAAHLVFHALAGIADVRWIPGAWDAAWLAVNAVVALGLASLSLRD